MTIPKIIFMTLLLAAKFATGQQDPLYSMYMFDKMLINPAFTGSSNWVTGTLKHRSQNTGMQGHPVTETFNVHSPIQKKHIGVGFKLIKDKVAIMSNLNVAALFSYHLNFAGGKLSFGIEAGVLNKKIDYRELVLSKRDDNALPLTVASSVVPDLSVGAYYQKRQFYAGLSNYHLIKKRFDYSTATSGSHLYKHIYLLAGNIFDISKKLSVEPSVLIKYQPSSKLQMDVNAMVYYNERFGAGLQYRTGDALVTVLRIGITEGLRIAYSYDVTISKLSPYSKGSHEIVISYGIKLPPPPTQKEIHPRYYF
jgi:type IX secretion system PorP/SprF family membrane protein